MQNFKRANDQDPGYGTERANSEAAFIKKLILEYFSTVRKTMNDMVPKTIMAFLVNKSKNQVQNTLVQAIYNDGSNFQGLLIEDQDTKQRREKCEVMVKTLKQSLEILNEVRDFYFDEKC